MARFLYTAVDGQGKEQKGKIEAESEQDAVTKLKHQQLYPTSVNEIKATASAGSAAARKGGSIFGAPKIRTKDLTRITRQLTVLLGAGLPLVRSLRTLERQAKSNPAIKRVMGDLANSVEGGSTFSEALSLNKRTFNKLYVNMVKAGEASGSLEIVLERLAEFMEKAQRIAGKVKAALIYPIAVLFIAGAITLGLMIYIVPKFSKMFKEMLPGEDLPRLTQAVVNVSDFILHKALILVAGVIFIIIVFVIFKRTKTGAYILDWLAIKMPPLSALAIRATTAKFARTLGTLMDSGVPILQSLLIVKDTTGNEVIGRTILTVHDAVKEGEGMTKPLEASQVFPGMVVSMIEVGEETGALPDMLNRIADVYEEEVDRAVEALTSIIEPIMIVILAVVIGPIIVGLFLPLIVLMDKL